ncbi:MAG TPA: DNA alkylation repair protein [Acidimicrobiales bacterium]|nr:DNA alkylation repair protein [Acidimicrobiales bacterium]
MAADRALIKELRAALRAEADPSRAAGAQAYMKSSMPFLGLTVPVMRRITKDVSKAHVMGDADTWRATCLALWRKAEYRDERYAALELTGHKPYQRFQTSGCMPMYEEFVVDGAWWDYVDLVAIHRIGPLLVAYRDEIEPIVRAWSTDADMWKRRASIICQVSAKGDVDLGLLYDCIEPNMADKEFFIRKAIGWALRSHAWLNPGEVERYVAANADRLSGLSKREALKNIGKLRK